LQRHGSQQIWAEGVDRPCHFLYSACTDENRPDDLTQGGERSQVRRKTARNPYTRSGLEHISTYTLLGFKSISNRFILMTCQLTVFFDNPVTRKQFMRDVDSLILHHDHECREEQDRMNYEDTLSFYMPDHDQDGEDPLKNPWSRKNFSVALKAAEKSGATYS
jgi:hypothetical protein